MGNLTPEELKVVEHFKSLTIEESKKYLNTEGQKDIERPGGTKNVRYKICPEFRVGFCEFGIKGKL